MKVYVVNIDNVPLVVSIDREIAVSAAKGAAYALARVRPFMIIYGVNPSWRGFNEFEERLNSFDSFNGYLKASVENGCGWISDTSITIAEIYVEG